MIKPFNLERAKAGDPVMTKGGCRVRILCFDAKRKDFPIVGLVDKGDTEIICSWTSDGEYSNVVSCHDALCMAPKVKLWRRLYRHTTADPYREYHYFISAADPQRRSSLPPLEWEGAWEEFEVEE